MVINKGNKMSQIEKGSIASNNSGGCVCDFVIVVAVNVVIFGADVVVNAEGFDVIEA
ncbi:hypothetical protein IJI28_02820 [Candidatus Saccharibacteria bacterium]|nr:hypothetical protein [Candidatus Saccharibacteria bacterium]